MHIIVVVPFVVLFLYIWKKRSQWAHAKLSNGFPLPPGPPRKPLVGNLLDIPRSQQWHQFLKWKEHYGDIVYVEALGNKMLIVNTLEAVSDLLGSRHAIYCDRPKFIMAGELMGLDNVLFFC
ncbi:hypothetical protein JVU11DRAFT_8224 [Chiua virens]|nr:hypothetical protein JVU11DRAFT_8224 [Chiua virens]